MENKGDVKFVALENNKDSSIEQTISDDSTEKSWKPAGDNNEETNGIIYNSAKQVFEECIAQNEKTRIYKKPTDNPLFRRKVNRSELNLTDDDDYEDLSSYTSDALSVKTSEMTMCSESMPSEVNTLKMEIKNVENIDGQTNNPKEINENKKVVKFNLEHEKEKLNLLATDMKLHVDIFGKVFDKNYGTIITNIINVLNIIFLCVGNKWTWNVITVIAKVSFAVFIYLVLACSTVIIAIILNSYDAYSYALESRASSEKNGDLQKCNEKDSFVPSTEGIPVNK